MTNRYEHIPVTVLTGFLGSGKTTLLKRLLTGEEGAGVAVLMNELGEVSLDDLFVQELTDTTLVLKNGCVCCSMREDLRQGIRRLIDDRSQNKVPEFNRIVVETTGLADPTPIAQTLVGDLLLRNHVRLANIIATVDALFGADEIESHEESLRQAAIADRIVLTKTDIATPEQTERARAKIHEVNPVAIVLDANAGKDLWPELFDIDPFNPKTKTDEVKAWLKRLPNVRRVGRGYVPAPGERVRSYHEETAGQATTQTFALTTDTPLNWPAFSIWLSALIHRYGPQILRVKGLLNVPGAKGPVVLNTVQSHITPPMHLDGWPSDDHSSRIVFIVQGVEPAMVERSLHTFLSLLETPDPTDQTSTGGLS